MPEIRVGLAQLIEAVAALLELSFLPPRAAKCLKLDTHGAKRILALARSSLFSMDLIRSRAIHQAEAIGRRGFIATGVKLGNPSLFKTKLYNRLTLFYCAGR